MSTPPLSWLPRLVKVGVVAVGVVTAGQLFGATLVRAQDEAPAAAPTPTASATDASATDASATEATPADPAPDDPAAPSSAVPLPPPSPHAPGVIIGAVLPLSGPLSDFGLSARAALELAVERINAAGGIGGRDIDLMVADGKGQPADSLLAAADLIDNRGAVALIGPLSSAAARPVAVKLAVRREVPMIAIGATARGLEALSDSGLVYRILPGDAHQSVALANYAASIAQKRTMSCLFLRNSYGANMAQTFVLWAEQRQLETGPCLAYDQDTLVPELLGSLPDKASEALLVVGAAPDALGLVGALAEASPQRLLLLTEGLRVPGLLEVIPPDRQGQVALAGAFLDRQGPAWTSVLEPLHSQQREEPLALDPTADLIAAASYDAMAVLALALEGRTTNPDASLKDAIIAVSAPPGQTFLPDGLAQALEAVREGKDIDYDGASGPIDLDAKGEPVSLIAIWRLRDQAFALDRVFRSYRAPQ